MDDRTRRYLRGRFGDYYRREPVSIPPAADAREWGYIPWTTGTETTMVRHQALQTTGDIAALLEQDRPCHAYYSAGRYDHPGISDMAAKGWRGSDLIFDLDADHLPGVDPQTDDLETMLAACKGELECLLSFLSDDFGFDAPTIVFSGGRGYHVHVRESDVRSLGREARRDIVDYIRGHGVELESVLDRELVAGTGRETPAGKRSLADGGWGRRVRRATVAYLDRLVDMSVDEARAELLEIDGIGASRADTILDVLDSKYDEVAAGNIDVHPAMLTLLGEIVPRAVTEQQAAIDEPVTTDIHRLIRLPGSLHGGTGLCVRPLDAESLADFDPLVDAVAPTFRDHRITVDVIEPGPVAVGEESRRVTTGITVVPEYAGIFLLCQGRARKVQEQR